MHLFVCLAGLPREALVEVSKTPARFTGDKGTAPIANPMSAPFIYRPGMENYYHERLSRQISQIGQNDEVGVIFAYVDYSEAGDFVSRFFPFALVASVEPFYYCARSANVRRSELVAFVKKVEIVVTGLRRCAAVMRDHFSGQNFSPLTLPIRNFRSEDLQVRLREIFSGLGSVEDPRSLVQKQCNAIIKKHPLKTDEGHRHYFEDERGLRFKSPGRDTHGWSRGKSLEHNVTCHINSRVRLGGSLRANFHYDCDYERRGLEAAYPNCHNKPDPPAQKTHVNIAPNDAIR